MGILEKKLATRAQVTGFVKGSLGFEQRFTEKISAGLASYDNKSFESLQLFSS